MNNFDALKIANSPAWEAVKKLQENSALAAVRELQSCSAFKAALELENSGAFAAVRELQNTMNAVKDSMGGAYEMLQQYQKDIAPIAETFKAINVAYAPIFEQTRMFDSLNMKGIVSGLQTSASAMRVISGINLNGIAGIIDALPKYDFLSDLISDDFTIDDAGKLYESGEITQDDINEELSEIVKNKQFSPVAQWDKIKKSKWFLAIKILLGILLFLGKPIIEYTEDKVLDAIGITQLCEEFGVFETIDSIFAPFENGVVSEEDAKSTVDEAKTGNISKQKRENLLAKIKEIRTFISSAPQDDNTGNLLSYLSELEKDVCGKKYGLVFEEHREDIDEVLDTHTPVLTEDAELFIDNGGEMNFLIEGDNLASLKLLEKTHKGKIDLIYIDPPYNTGNRDFIYGDAFIDQTDTFRHSKWCSFISGRLMQAKKLLSDKGCIFISIDDNEYSTLKCLCDSIFGDDKYIATAVWQKRTSPDARVRLSSGHEYILVYAAKTIDTNIVFNQLPLNEDDAAGYKNPDNDPRGPWRSTDFGAQGWRPNQMYTIVTPGGKEYKPSDGRCWKNVESKYLELLAEGRMWFGIDGKGVPRKKVYLSEKEGKNIWTWWTNKEVGHTQEATQELKSIFGTKTVFDYPKPVRLIQRILQIATQKNSVILDFFAGSGTTAQAIMKLNSDDNGNRRFILCTNNENNICRDVTYERIKRVVDKEGYEASLKYYKVEYIPISERMYYEYADDLLMHIRELVELENGVNFKGNAEIGIVLTEEELDEFIENVDAFSKCKKLYMGHDLLPSDEQEETLKARDIEISIIPDYYYRDLQEN